MAGYSKTASYNIDFTDGGDTVYEGFDQLEDFAEEVSPHFAF